MMALVSLMVLSAQAQANFQVSVSTFQGGKNRCPVVVDLSKLGAIGDIQRAVVTVDGKGDSFTARRHQPRLYQR